MNPELETQLNEWPVEYKKELVIGDPTKPVAICSLWSDRRYTAGKVGIENVAVVGNLYSHGPGIEGIVRNILANPAIRVVIIAGKDKSLSAETLRHFMAVGVEKTDLGWTIPLSPAIAADHLPPGSRTIDPAIPSEAIENLRANVELVDLRNKDWPEVEQTVLLNQGKIPFAQPALYPKTESKVKVLRGEDIGFVFRGEKPQEVWLEILNTIRQFGNQAGSRYTSSTQEVLNVMAVLDGDLDQIVAWPEWVGHSLPSIKDYSRQLIEGIRIDEEDSYAYGERMRVRKGDQIAYIINQLKERPSSRAFLVDLWDVETDLYRNSDNPPCMTQVWFRVYQGRLCANFSYRSHDIYGAWIKNAMGDRLLQAHVANQAGLPLGPTTIISYSAHIYEHNFAQIDDTISKHPLRWKFTEDPRGNFVVTIEDGQIVVRHANQSGSAITLRGKTAQGLYRDILFKNLVLLPNHAMYIGYELARAEMSLKEGKDFEQDKA